MIHQSLLRFDSRWTNRHKKPETRDASDEQEPVGVVASIQDTFKANENEKQERGTL